MKKQINWWEVVWFEHKTFQDGSTKTELNINPIWIGIGIIVLVVIIALI